MTENRTINTSDPSTTWQRFRGWWRDTKPHDLLAVLFAALSVVFAGVALWLSHRTAERQESFELEQSAPILAPGTAIEDRGRILDFKTDYREVHKRADRMLLTRRSRRGHVVVPMRNGGAGIALTVGLPVLVQDCEREPQALPGSTVGLLGTYVLPSGSSEQLAYFQPKKHDPRYRSGTVEVDSKRYWYGWDYHNFGRAPKPAKRNVLVWYTDGAREKLRWTCVTYNAAETEPYGELYVVEQQLYGSKDFPKEADTISP